MRLSYLFLMIFIAIVIFFILVMIIDCHRLVVRKYNFKFDGLKNSIKMVLLTDLHGVSFGKNNQKLIQRISELNPDIIVIAGDMYTSAQKSGIENAMALLAKLSLKYPIYYADGNHELKTKERVNEFGSRYKDYVELVSNVGVVFVNNSKVKLEDYGICINGLSLPFKYYKKRNNISPSYEELEQLIGRAEPEYVNLLLAHNPEYFEEYAKWGASLVLSGHYHGGLMRLPVLGGVIGPRYNLFPKYDFGVFKKDNSYMVLSCGLGTHTLPIRIFNPGEISYIELNP